MSRLLPVFIVVLVGCGSEPTGPSPVPTLPVTTPLPVTPTVDPRVRPVDPRFDLNLWDELVYAKHDRELGGNYSGPMTEYGSRVLDHMRDFYLWTSGHGGMTLELEQDIRAAIPQVWRDLTADPFTGRIESGTDGRERAGWTRVQINDTVSCGGFFSDLLYTTRDDPMVISLSAGPGCDVVATFRHEMAHMLGFSHVSDPSSLMHTMVGRGHFTASEKYHARLAYEVGTGAYYCGWPFSEACFTEGRR